MRRLARPSLAWAVAPNCSRVCCMAVAKQAHLAHDRMPGAEITVFYMDVRAFGKGFEEFYDRVRNEGVLYRRGNPSEIISVASGLSCAPKIPCWASRWKWKPTWWSWLSVCSHARMPSDWRRCSIWSAARTAIFLEEHPKLRTVESNVPGVFLAGCCQGPKDIPDTVAHAKAAASAAMICWLEWQRCR